MLEHTLSRKETTPSFSKSIELNEKHPIAGVLPVDAVLFCTKTQLEFAQLMLPLTLKGVPVFG